MKIKNATIILTESIRLETDADVEAFNSIFENCLFTTHAGIAHSNESIIKDCNFKSNEASS